MIGCSNSGLDNFIAATSDNSSSIQWGGVGALVNASNVFDGATNTATIVSALGPGAYAAALCASYEVDSQGNSPLKTLMA